MDEVRAGLPAAYPKLWRFCLALTRNRASADDLAQRTCERALERIETFREGTFLDRWLFTIARRIWLNELRSAGVRQGNGIVDIGETDIADEKTDHETNIFAREVFTLVQSLPDAQRETLVLVYVEGYTYREAAEMLEIPIGTVMSRLATARRSIAAKTESGTAK